MIGRAFIQIGVLHLVLREPDLAVGWELHIVRHVQVFKNLLGNALKHRRGHLPALVQTNGRVKDDRNGDGGIVDGCKSGEGAYVLCAGLSAGGGINFLRGAGLSCRGVAFEHGFAAGSMQHDAAHHLAHLRGCHG